MTINGNSILVTGGTGSFGKKFIKLLLGQHTPRRLVVFSRDELKQFEMREEIDAPNPSLPVSMVLFNTLELLRATPVPMRVWRCSILPPPNENPPALPVDCTWQLISVTPSSMMTGHSACPSMTEL